MGRHGATIDPIGATARRARDGAPKEGQSMNGLRGASRDPWWDDGTGARRVRTRRRVVGATALAVAIVACGLTVAAWAAELLPAASRLLG
jgi:hypothetical protein